MMKHQFIQLIILCLLLLAIEPIHAAQKRVALVIGNSAYKDAPLKNPSNDATDMAAKLKKLGFKVDKLINADARSMKKAISRFGKKLHQEDTIGLFYFAGHGVQVKGNNYLLPIGTLIESEADVEYEAVNAGRILNQMSVANNGLNMVILDACRNNPYARSFRSSTRGLARMEAPTGSLILYATSPGNVAADGTGRNGLFTEKLMQSMDKEGQKIEDVFKQTAIAVSRESKKQQVPYIEGVILGDFYFLPTVINSPGSSSLPTASKLTTFSATQAEIVFWQSVEKQASKAGYEAYLKQWPKGQFAVLANLQLSKINPTDKSTFAVAGSANKYHSDFFEGRQITGRTKRNANINIEIKSEKNARIKVKPANFLAQEFSEDGYWFVDGQKFICLKFKRFNRGKVVCRYPTVEDGKIKLMPRHKDPNKPVWLLK